MAAKKDYYKLLDIPKTATQEEIKKAYHKMAKKYHPDKNPNSPDTAEKFKIVKEAYEVLSDPVRKSDHDSSVKRPQNTNPSQTRYETSNFPNFFSGGFKSGQPSARAPGPKIFTFNVYGNTAGVPFADILKMFFGGMSDFGPGPGPARTARRPADNPHNAALCQFCKQLFSVQELIIHQKICPQKPRTAEDFENLFPGYSNMPANKPHDWRQQHQDTLNAIKRDRERAGASNGKSWSEQFPNESNFEYEIHQSGLVQCPSCNRRFNMEAASHHIPHCMQKSNEENFRPHNSPKSEDRPKESSFHRAREYAKNVKKNNADGHNNNQGNLFDAYWDQDEEEYMNSGKTSNCSSDRDLYSQFCNFSAGYTLNRAHRKSTFPDIRVNNGFFSESPLSGKSRRNTTSGIFDTTFPSFSQQFQFNRSHHACDNCVRMYGFEAAKVYCSCGFKKATNVNHK